jgi:hypothetical protein
MSLDPFNFLILMIIVIPLVFKAQACYIISMKLPSLLHDPSICGCIVGSICIVLVVSNMKEYYPLSREFWYASLVCIHRK